MEVDGAVDVYGDWHRQFLQVLLSRPVLYANELRQLVVEICGEEAAGETAQLKTFLKTLRDKVQPLGLDLHKGVSESDGKPVYALINTSGGEETAACAGFSEPQLRFLRAVVQEVVTSVSGHISQMAALNLAEGMTKADAQTLIARLKRDFWLEEVGERVALHARCIMELEPYLKQHFAEYVPACPLCNRVTVRGQSCERDGCGAKYHRHCLRKMRVSVEVVKCRKCNRVLPREEGGDGAARER